MATDLRPCVNYIRHSVDSTHELVKSWVFNSGLCKKRIAVNLWYGKIQTMEALTFLAKIKKAERLPVYVLNGDEEFLKKNCRDAIRNLVLGKADFEFSLSSFEGDTTSLSEVRNDLETRPFTSPIRLVEVESADSFVTSFREGLEKYFEKPSKVGVLVLFVKTFPENTRLATKLPDEAKISCKAAKEGELGQWCVNWAKSKHQKSLAQDSAELLVMLAGTNMGMLAGEIEKLATSIGEEETITTTHIETYINRSKTADAFKILDAIGDNRPHEALLTLHNLFQDGEAALGILGPLGYQLRKLSAVDRYVSEGQNLASAMDSAGVFKWPKARDSTAKQLKRLGKKRVQMLSSWLVELNAGLKGGNPLPDRVQLERLIIQLAKNA
jgi:DNA polymerase III subunit delta